MHETDKFEFSRSRGVVWVCDIEGSSQFLNDNASAGDLEEYLPRLHWMASNLVAAAGGKFIKWTGDGFLAWFETPLHRDLASRAFYVIDAITHLTVFSNVTQFGVKPKRKFLLRHGVAYEQDALVTRILHPSGHTTLDLTGRSVVLAFRLSGVKADFPSVVADRDVISALASGPPCATNFKSWKPTADERLRYFKGQRWGSSSLFKTTSRPAKPLSKRTLARHVKTAVASADGGEGRYAKTDLWKNLDPIILAGPDWAKAALTEYSIFVRDELLGPLREAAQSLEAAKKRGAAESRAWIRKKLH
jgi:class 3 adenylate cyclase